MAAEMWIEANISVYSLATSAVYDPNNGCVYVTNQNSGNVSVVNASQGKIVASFSVLGNPVGIAYDSDHHTILVNDLTSNDVALVSDSTNKVVRTIPAGQSPSIGLLYLPSNGLAYVANYVSNNLTVINMTTNRTVASIPVGVGPQWIEYDPDNKMLYVANNGGSNVTVVDPATNTPVRSISVPSGPFGALYDPLDHRILVSIGGGGSGTSISVINATAGTVVGSISVGSIPRGEIFDSVTGYVYVAEYGSGDVRAINGSTLVSVGTVTTPAYAGIAFDPVTATLYVPAGGSVASYLAVISTALAETEPTFSLAPGKVVTRADLGANVSVGTTIWAVGSGRLSPAVWVTPTGAALCTPPVLSGGGKATSTRCVTATLGNATVWINVTDRTGHVARSFSTLEVNPGPIAGWPVANRSSVDLGQQVSFQANVSGGIAPYSYAWTGLPPACPSAGSPVGCVVSAAGILRIQVTAQDSGGGSVTSPPLVFNAYADPGVTAPVANRTSADIGQSVSFSVLPFGGSGVYQIGWAGLPPSCATVGYFANCTISQIGDFSVSATATDSNGYENGSAAVVFHTYPDPVISGPSASRPSADVGQSVVFRALPSGGSNGFRIRWSGLPEGCNTANVTALTCQPISPGNSFVRESAMDSNGFPTLSAILPFVVYDRLSITSLRIVGSAGSSGGGAALETAVGHNVSFQASIAGGFGTPVASWSGLPAGCTGRTLTFTCAPRQVGSFNVSLSVTDANNFTAVSSIVTLVVSASPPPIGVPSHSFLPTLELAAIAGVVVLGAALASILLLRCRRRARPRAREAVPRRR